MRRSTCFVPILVVAIATATSFAVAPAASAAKNCGSYGDAGDGEVRWTYGQVYGAGIFNVRARGVSCRRARRLSKRAFRSAGQSKRWRHHGWRCRLLKDQYEFSDLRCRKNGNSVRWQTGA